MENSIERIVPDAAVLNQQTGDKSLQLHLERYHFAGKHLLNGVVADIACGVGYGSFLLATHYSEKITEILGVDIDSDAIKYARSRYAHPNIVYVQQDITQFVPQKELQNIVCLETLEHLPDPHLFINHIAQYLQRKGLFIVSAPITPSMDANPFHLHDFTKSSLKKLFTNAGFIELAVMQQVQPYTLKDIFFKKEQRTSNVRSGGLLKYYVSKPGKFFLRLKSLLSDGLCNKYVIVVFQKT